MTQDKPSIVHALLDAATSRQGMDDVVHAVQSRPKSGS